MHDIDSFLNIHAQLFSGARGLKVTTDTWAIFFRKIDFHHFYRFILLIMKKKNDVMV